jgi:hypothetical protein
MSVKDLAISYIKEISETTKSDDEIVRTTCLGSVTISRASYKGRDWFFGTWSMMLLLDRADPTTQHIEDFVDGKKTAAETISIIDRLENLKAFW